MEKEWTEIDTAVDTVDWKGKPMHVTGVKALRNIKTGEIRVYPFEVARAQINQIAECYHILPRDVGTLLMIFAKPGFFKGGEVLYKYHLQKLLFYLEKTLDLNGYVKSLQMDKFIAAKNGPVPEHLNEDLVRLQSEKLIKVQEEEWEKGKISKRIILTKEGIKIAEELWKELSEPYKKTAIKVKERIYPLSPENVRHLVHNEYPEYRDSYVENDIE